MREQKFVHGITWSTANLNQVLLETYSSTETKWLRFGGLLNDQSQDKVLVSRLQNQAKNTLKVIHILWDLKKKSE